MGSPRRSPHMTKRKRDKVVVLSATQRTGVVPPAKPLHVVNVVLVAKMVPRASAHTHISLTELAEATGGRYAAAGFQCVTTRGRNPNVITHTFSTGVQIACGAASVGDDMVATWRMRRVLRQKLGIATWITNCAPRNTVASVATGYAIDLARFCEDHNVNTTCDWEADVYPGLRYFPNGLIHRPGVILHASGAINIVGTTGIEAAAATYEALNIAKYRV